MPEDYTDCDPFEKIEDAVKQLEVRMTTPGVKCIIKPTEDGMWELCCTIPTVG